MSYARVDTIRRVGKAGAPRLEIERGDEIRQIRARDFKEEKTSTLFLFKPANARTHRHRDPVELRRCKKL